MKFISNSNKKCPPELPVSLEYMIKFDGKLLSVNCRCRGYLVLVNRCNTMQMRPAKTAIPVETPRSVGRSEVSVDMSSIIHNKTERKLIPIGHLNPWQWQTHPQCRILVWLVSSSSPNGNHVHIGTMHYVEFEHIAN